MEDYAIREKLSYRDIVFRAIDMYSQAHMRIITDPAIPVKDAPQRLMIYVDHLLAMASIFEDEEFKERISEIASSKEIPPERKPSAIFREILKLYQRRMSLYEIETPLELR